MSEVSFIDMQGSFFFKKVQTNDYDGIDVFITREGNIDHGPERNIDHGPERHIDHGWERNIDHGPERHIDHGPERRVRASGPKLRPRMLQNPRLYQGDILGPLPEVTHLISILIDNLAGSGVIGGSDDTSVASSNHHFRHRLRGIDWFLWPRGVIPFVLDFNASKSHPSFRSSIIHS